MLAGSLRMSSVISYNSLVALHYNPLLNEFLDIMQRIGGLNPSGSRAVIGNFEAPLRPRWNRG